MKHSRTPCYWYFIVYDYRSKIIQRETNVYDMDKVDRILVESDKYQLAKYLLCVRSQQLVFNPIYSGLCLYVVDYATDCLNFNVK